MHVTRNGLSPVIPMSMRGNPFREIERMLEQMTRQFEQSTEELEESPIRLGDLGSGSVSVDLAEQDDRYVVTADLPGYDKDNIDVQLADETVQIRAEREEESERTDENYIRRERAQQSVSRSVTLPESVSEDDVSATYHNGVLTITLPKADPSEGGRQIDIE